MSYFKRKYGKKNPTLWQENETEPEIRKIILLKIKFCQSMLPFKILAKQNKKEKQYT